MPTYLEAGVDIEGAERHVGAIAPTVTSTWTDDVIGGFGGFAAGVTIPEGYHHPVLMMSTDGVGTKLDVARLAGRWDGVGHDLVAMCVDDLAAVGARPIGFVDYLAVGTLDNRRDADIVASIAGACLLAGCPLLGGETAEHPGVMTADAVDLAGAVMGVVEKGEQLSPSSVHAGNLVVGLHSPNLRSNGFSLVRSAMAEDLADHTAQLLEPSVIYSPVVLGAIETGAVMASAHITGGGIVGNLARAVPDGLGATVDTGTWDTPAVFETVAAHGVGRDEMYATFNMGIGFILIVDPAGLDEVLDATSAHSPSVIGTVRDQPGIELI